MSHIWQSFASCIEPNVIFLLILEVELNTGSNTTQLTCGIYDKLADSEILGGALRICGHKA